MIALIQRSDEQVAIVNPYMATPPNSVTVCLDRMRPEVVKCQ